MRRITSAISCIVSGCWARMSWARGSSVNSYLTCTIVAEQLKSWKRPAVFFCHWPEAFFELLDELSAGTPPSKSNRVAAAFGPVYRDMYAKGTWRAFTMLRESFEQYIRLRWTGQVAKRNRRLGDEAATEHVWMPATRAAKELGWRAPRLRRAITAGILRGHVRALPSGRTMSVAHREDVDQVKKSSCSGSI